MLDTSHLDGLPALVLTIEITPGGVGVKTHNIGYKLFTGIDSVVILSHSHKPPNDTRS